MNNILSIDTSTQLGQVVLLSEGKVVYEEAFVSERSHNSQIFAPLEKALNRCDTKVSLIVVGSGPGSYTGVRIGIAAGIGISMVKKIRMIGIPSICAAELKDNLTEYVFVGDARRGEKYFVNVQNHQLLSDPVIVKSDENFDNIIQDKSKPIISFENSIHPKAIETKPSAIKLAHLGNQMTNDEINELSKKTPIPLYLRSPFITKPKKIGKTGPEEGSN